MYQKANLSGSFCVLPFQHTLLSEFLTHLKRGKDDELMRLKRVCDVIQDDLNLVNDMMANIKVKGSGVALSASTASAVASGKVDDHDVEVDEHDKSDKMDQVWPLTKFFSVSFLYKIIDLPGGQINDP